MSNTNLCRHCTHCQPQSFRMKGELRTENVCVLRVISFPEPCSSYQREPGADDE